MILLHLGARGERNFHFPMTSTVTLKETSSVPLESSPRDSLFITKIHHCTVPNEPKLGYVNILTKQKIWTIMKNEKIVTMLQYLT